MVTVFSYAVVLTGSIATGKSSVATLFKDDGFEMIDADSIAHQILDTKYLEIAQLFGNEVIKEQRVNRKALGTIVFSDAQKRKDLEDLLHPLIYEKIEIEAKKLDQKERPYFIDIPLFFESNRYAISKVLVVYTPEKLQLQRLMNRDNSTRKEAQKRIDTQISIEEKVKKARYVIDNSGTLIALKNEYQRVKEEILGDFP
jgi:dephospho-CoA kinase